LAFYELPEYYDHLHRARVEASYRPVVLLDSLGSLLQNAMTLIAMGAILIPFGPWLPVALLVSTLPPFYVVLRYTLRQHQWRLRTTADERRTWYYDWLLTSGETAAELRLFSLGGHFQSAYQALRGRLRHERVQLAKDQSLAELGAGTAGLLITAAALAWMVWQALQGFVSLGNL
jgi:ATP-binding cassette subfamily B protein